MSTEPDDRPLPRRIEDADPRRFVSIGGPVREFRLSLRLFGDDLDPDEVSELLGSAPSDSYRKGDLLPGRYRRAAKRGAWFLTADHREGTDKGFSNVVDELIDSLNGDLDVWYSLTRRYHVDLFCGVFMEHTGNEGVELPLETMKRLVDRGVKIEFDIYY